jgi:hypothetical protein
MELARVASESKSSGPGLVAVASRVEARGGKGESSVHALRRVRLASRMFLYLAFFKKVVRERRERQETRARRKLAYRRQSE